MGLDRLTKLAWLKKIAVECNASEGKSIENMLGAALERAPKPLKKTYNIKPMQIFKDEDTRRALGRAMTAQPSFRNLDLPPVGNTLDNTRSYALSKASALKLAGSPDSIKFPVSEKKQLLERLNHRLAIYTTRVAGEQGKYEVGKVYQSNLGVPLEAVEIKTRDNIADHPHKDYLTQKQRELIDGRKYDVVKLERTK